MVRFSLGLSVCLAALRVRSARADERHRPRTLPTKQRPRTRTTPRPTTSRPKSAGRRSRIRAASTSSRRAKWSVARSCIGPPCKPRSRAPARRPKRTARRSNAGVIDDVAADGSVTFTHSVESIDMWQKTQGRTEIRYNSQTDAEPPPGYEEAAAAVGVPLTAITMNDHGKILKRQEKRHSRPACCRLR